MAALDFPAAPSDGDTYTPSGSSVTFTYSTAKGSWNGKISASGGAGGVPTTITLAATNTTDATHYPLFASAATGDEEPRTDTGLTYNPNTEKLITSRFEGALIGDVTGDVSGSAATVTDATQAAVTTMANLATVGTVATGTWNATAIASQYGGTGQDFSSSSGAVLVSSGTMSAGTVSSTYGGTGQNFGSSTGIISVSSGTMSVSSTLAETLGGTNQTSYNQGDVLYASGSNSLSKLSVGTSGQVLTVNSGGTMPEWAAASGASLLTDLTDVNLNIGNFTGSIHIATDGGAPVTGSLSNAQNNIIIGPDDKSITSGDNNIMLGNDAGTDLTTGSDNILMGNGAGMALSSDIIGNVFLGSLVANGLDNIASSYNVGIGVEAIKDDGGGAVAYNVGIGYKAGRGSSSQSNHDYGVYIGYETGLELEDAQKNVFIGYRAGKTVSGGDENIFIGNTAGESVTSGSNNVIFGDYSGSSSMTGEIHLYAGTNPRITVNNSGVVRFNDAYSFPDADGSNGEVLQTNGSGTLSFASAGGSLTVADEGSNLSNAATTLDFVGSGVTASGTGATKTITIAGGSPGGSTTQLQYNNNGSFGGMSQWTYDGTNIEITAGTLNVNDSSAIDIAQTGVIKFTGNAATQDSNNTQGMYWYDGSYYMHIRPTAWASNNDIDNAIVLPTWGVDLNMFSQRNKKDLRDHSITHDSSNGKYIYILTDEYNRTSHDTGSDKYSILIGHDVERGTQSSSSSYQISMGYQASYNMNGGQSNVHIGYKAGYGNISSGGSYNIHMGHEAGYGDADYSYNIVLGYQASYNEHHNQSDYNVAIGYHSFYQESATQAEQYNIAIGYKAAYGEGYGSSNYRSFNVDDSIAIGRLAMYQGLPGNNNIAIGHETMHDGRPSNISDNIPERSHHNIAMGYQSMKYMKTGTTHGSRTPSEMGRQYNVAIGYAAGYGYDSTSEGLDAFGVYIGYEAGYNIRGTAENDSDTSDQYRNTRGSKNVFIGYRAGKDVTFGKGNVIIGGYEGTSGTNFNNEVHIYAGDTERMKIDSSGLTVNGSAVGGGAPSHVSAGVLGHDFRGQDNVQAKLSHLHVEDHQESYPPALLGEGTGSAGYYEGWRNWAKGNHTQHNDHYIYAVPPAGYEKATVVMRNSSSGNYSKVSWTWANINSNQSYYRIDANNTSYGHIYVYYENNQSAPQVYADTSNPSWDDTNGIWRLNSGSYGTWLGTYSKETSCNSNTRAVNWQPEGFITSSTSDAMYPACTSYSSAYHYVKRNIERSTQHGMLGSYWQDSSMPPGTNNNSSSSSDWLTWTTTSTSWDHVYDNDGATGGSNWTGDLVFHPTQGTPIDIECEIHYAMGDSGAYAMFGLGMREDQNYTVGWNYSKWLTDYADYQYGHSYSTTATAGHIKYAKLSRRLEPGNIIDTSNYKWTARTRDFSYPWLVGLWAKTSNNGVTLTVHQFRLKATYYA